MAKKKDFYYMMPGSAGGARRARLRSRFWSILVGAFIAGVLGCAMYYKDSL